MVGGSGVSAADGLVDKVSLLGTNIVFVSVWSKTYDDFWFPLTDGLMRGLSRALGLVSDDVTRF